ncbi:acetyl-CoA carboxylase biotin carboxyl carrier protein [Limosilactobacillus allomucosae]|uniref:Biotin carboxyl carrier protein of acetyl-CoA carboxylase n=1 Tax=Limosilactobacillus allomucosae TaxID=3142938 RepID=A0ABV0I4Y5_9LACO
MIDLDTKNIEELIKLLKENDLTELEYEKGDERICVKRSASESFAQPVSVAPQHGNPSHHIMAPKEVVTSSNTINAPTIGVFYTAKSPQDPPYVKPGDHIKQGDVVGVIEAMKVFTNVVADRDGIVEKVLVNNEEGVEYDQPLIQIK